MADGDAILIRNQSKQAWESVREWQLITWMVMKSGEGKQTCLPQPPEVGNSRAIITTWKIEPIAAGLFATACIQYIYTCVGRLISIQRFKQQYNGEFRALFRTAAYFRKTFGVIMFIRNLIIRGK